MRKLLRNNQLSLLLGLLLPLVFGGAAAAQQAEDDPLDRLFTIQAVKVDETAARASEARRTALQKAEEQAYGKLLRKLTQPEGRAKLPTLTLREIEAMISGIEVVDEQSSSRRYLATLDVRFEPGLVSQFLAEHQVPHVLGTGRGILVLGAHRRGLKDILWESDAVIRTAREQVDWLNRIRQYEFPRGEILERANVTFAQVYALEGRDAAASLARAYGAHSALLLSSEWHADGGAPYLTYSYLSTDGGATLEGRIDGVADEVSALAAMYDEVLDGIDSAWRAQLLVDTGVGGELEVMVATTSLEGYNDILKRLGEVSLVSDVRMIEVALPLSRLQFRYTGREDQLVLALRYAGLGLTEYGASRLLARRADDN